MRDNKLGYTCERRAMYIVDGGECVRAFLHCCNDVVARSMEAGEEEMILARSTFLNIVQLIVKLVILTLCHDSTILYASL